MVFAATGSASFDFYGVTRHGDNLFADCVLALDARTGKRVWHFQGIRHDVWDWDFPAAAESRDGARATAARSTPSRRSRSTATSTCSIASTGAPLFPIEYAQGAAVDDRRRAGCRERAAVPDEAAAVRAPGADRRHADDAHAGGARGRARAVPQVCDGLLHAAVARRHDRVSRLRRRRGMGRRGVRSRHGAALRQLERDAVDRQADPEQRHVALQQQVRDLPSRRSQGLAVRAVARSASATAVRATRSRRSSARAPAACRRFPTWARATSTTSPTS